MPRLPRVAVGVMQPSVDALPMLWALSAALEQAGLRVQSFLARACFAQRDGATVITGNPARHLDSWLMSPDTCRELFLRGMVDRDLAIVDGMWACDEPSAQPAGGQLDVLCEWLHLPRLAIVDVSQLTDCNLPAPPSRLEGLLLDRVANKRDLCRLQTKLESLWGVPVLGALDACHALRSQLQALPPGEKPAMALCRALGDAFRRRSDLGRICRLARERDFPYKPAGCPTHRDAAGLRVALAYDDAFHCYFPDTLDLLESKGAVLCDFSPLGDERLPPGTDLVYLGCGTPERFAQALVENHCLIAALREHVCHGRRVYAECGGLAYLCEHIEQPDGSRLPMAGILPAAAHLAALPTAPAPLELTTSAESWLAASGARLRGYLNSRWTLAPTAPLGVLSGDERGPHLVARHQVIGSRLHLNFAADLAAAERFFLPPLRGPASSAAHLPNPA